MEEVCLFFTPQPKKKEGEYMPIQYKINVLSALKTAGFSSYRLRKEKIMGEATMQKLRDNEPVSWENISIICELLNCQPGDIMEYVSDRLIEKVNSSVKLNSIVQT
ncbi:helix-turn-helix domain-containing protein [Clostridium sp. Marseille-P2415]|uniref:helix-turn-helix domain-containing protein n=1 Tax=Clostridium sp. Marseille-P2415 TaxID=1805471 RepID=UPI0009888255|nr:helix-turn-helix transcriptional regulator [Clostridium sp. Marseille-P2415]